MTHTPIPWRSVDGYVVTGDSFRPNYIAVVDATEGREIAEANCHHLCHCVNTFPVLVDALQGMINEVRYLIDDGTLTISDVTSNEGFKRATEAIRTATEGNEE